MTRRTRTADVDIPAARAALSGDALEKEAHVTDVEPEVFGRYLLLESLGRGGMGEVWLARDTSAPEDAPLVAMKRIALEHSNKKAFQDRFYREAAAIYGLDPHRNIVRVTRFGEIDGRLYLEMEHVAGQTLRERLKDGALEPDEAVDIVEQLAAGLREVHGKKVEHRDVKPENVLLGTDPDGTLRVVLVDFGIVAMGIAGQAGVTRTGEIVGSPWYVAPERWVGLPQRRRWFGRRAGAHGAADLYSVGVMLFEMLTGRRPFQGDDIEQLGIAHVHGERPKPSVVRPGVPPAFDAVVACAMARDPWDRYRDVTALAEAARAAARGRRTDRWRTFPWGRVAAAAVAVAVVVGLVVGGERVLTRTPPLMVTGPVVVLGETASGPLAVAAGPNGPQAFVADQAGEVVVVDLQSHRKVQTLPPRTDAQSPGPVTEIVASPDGKEVYVSADGAVTAYDAVSLTANGSHPLPEGATHLAMGGSAPNSPLYAASAQGTAIFTLGTYGYAPGSGAAPTSVAVDPSSGTAYALYPGGSGSRIERVVSGGPGVPVAIVAADASTLAVTSDGSIAVAAGGTLALVDPDGGRSTPVALPSGATIRGLAVSEDGLYVLADDGRLSLVQDDEVASSVAVPASPGVVAVGPKSDCGAVVSAGSSNVTVVGEGSRCGG